MKTNRLKSRLSRPSIVYGCAATALVALAMTPVGCSVLLDGEEPQCETNADCSERGFAGATCQARRCVGEVKLDATPWGCVGKVAWDPPDTTRPLIYRAIYRGLFTEAAIVDAPASLCGRLDSSCSTPIATGKTDAEGWVEMDSFYGFDGFALVTAPPALPDLIGSLLVANPPLFEDSPREVVLPAHLANTAELQSVADLLGKSLNPLEGHVFIVAIDCQKSFAANAVFTAGTLATDTIPYYFDGGLPISTAAETDAEGLGGFLNLPPGFITLTGTVTGVGKYGVVTVPVVANHITYVGLPPSPLDGGG